MLHPEMEPSHNREGQSRAGFRYFLLEIKRRPDPSELSRYQRFGH